MCGWRGRCEVRGVALLVVVVTLVANPAYEQWPA
ncbi:hypothetical protein RKD49_002709 [Streptomyces glaucescens]